MKVKSLLFVLIFIFLFFNLIKAQVDNYEKHGYQVEKFSPKDLLKWEVQGKGIVENAGHDQLIMSETEGSKGIMIVSPRIYDQNVILSYDVMTLRPATVLIVEMSAHNMENYGLEFPKEYDGNNRYLFDNVNMYMFSFHNAPHNKPGPFVRKYPLPGNEPLVKTEKRYLYPGIYYNVEVCKQENIIWLKIDGIKVLECSDPEAYKGGKIIMRIRGTEHEVASCLIRNVKIFSKN
jgi:hypothetical protein